MKKSAVIVIVLLIVLFCSTNVGAKCAGGIKPISPQSYGLSEATTGIERFKVLERCHKDAVKKNAPISYSGIKSLDIEIPSDAASIPLPDNVFFAGVQLNVLNTQKNMTLFTRTNSAIQIKTSASSIDQGRFKNESELRNGQYLLIINDETPWVENRNGYDYGATRKDVLVVENGMAMNHPVYSYSNSPSYAKTTAVQIGAPLSYSNLNLSRDARSTKMTYLFSISNAYDVTLSNISITTPQDNELYGDAAIQIKDCAKVNISDIVINGTYSLTNKFGYGINLENVAMFSGERIFARTRWGVFGSNNVNGATLRDCDINRFDIHCYGKEVKCYNCKFADMYNQFSSVFGEVYFEKCMFTNYIPVLIEPSYNAYTPFDLSFKSCVFNLTGKKNYLMTLSGLEVAHNSRPELFRKSLPNITIKKCTVNLADDVKEWYIVNTGKVTYKEPLDYISKIEVIRLKINGNVDYQVFSSDIKTTEPLKLIRKRVKMKNKSGIN